MRANQEWGFQRLFSPGIRSKVHRNLHFQISGLRASGCLEFSCFASSDPQLLSRGFEPLLLAEVAEVHGAAILQNEDRRLRIELPDQLPAIWVSRVPAGQARDVNMRCHVTCHADHDVTVSQPYRDITLMTTAKQCNTNKQDRQFYMYIR